MSDEWRNSTLVPIYKNKGDVIPQVSKLKYLSKYYKIMAKLRKMSSIEYKLGG